MEKKSVPVRNKRDLTGKAKSLLFLTGILPSRQSCRRNRLFRGNRVYGNDRNYCRIDFISFPL